MPLMVVFVLYLDVTAVRPEPTPLQRRLEAFRNRQDPVDLLLLGDSNTYFGLHPEWLDLLLGTRSINLGLDSHFFLSQYLFVRDLLPHLRPGTRLLWSIHPENFFQQTFRAIYPMALADLPNLVAWHVPAAVIGDHLLAISPWPRLKSRLMWLRERIRPLPMGHGRRDDRQVNADLVAPSRSAKALALQRHYQRLSVKTQAKVRQGRVAYVELALRGGGLAKLVTDPDYFRTIHRQLAAEPRRIPLTTHHPDQQRALRHNRNLMIATLEMIRARGCLVIVNVMPYAPFAYASGWWDRATLERFLAAQVEPLVRGHGGVYLNPGAAGLTDEHFLDRMHLAWSGARILAERLAPALRPHLAPGGG
ncbi:MAG: hypothetical protein HQL82_12055 [Magnetococcales bacterium]|nr:hypothetical protein [Magnetococcales bacterium]